MNKQKGFTVIELVVVAAFLIIAGILGYSQFTKINNDLNNSHKRTAINAMYYSLEEGFFAKHSYYPEKINDDTLPTMDAELLKDPDGNKIGDSGSAYRYEAANCTNGQCKSYTLRSTLSGEADYVKESRHK